jgi:hypothetical protein
MRSAGQRAGEQFQGCRRDERSRRDRMSSMTRNSPERRTPEQVRAASRRLGLILLAVAAAFFVGIVVRQWLFGSG